MRALLTLNALGPKPGPPAAILAKTFRLTPSEAKLACIIARGAPPDIAARELKISRETARNQLKSALLRRTRIAKASLSRCSCRSGNGLAGSAASRHDAANERGHVDAPLRGTHDHAVEQKLRERCVLITNNSALFGTRRAHVTGFGVPEHHGSGAISTSTSG